MQGLIECLSAFIASIGFSFIFRIHHNFRFAIISSLGGALGWFVYLNTGALHNEIMSYFIAMVVVSLYAEMAARTMLYCTQGENILFLDSFIHTIAISASLALAIMIVSTIFKVIKKLSVSKK